MPDAGRPFAFGAIILAAGDSSRMGTAKQLLEIGGGPLVARVVNAALDSRARPVVVVVGANGAAVAAPLARLGVTKVHNPDWATGIASSIRAGLAAILGIEPALDAVLVALCDQPALTGEAIDRLAARHLATGLVAAARYRGRNGAPAVFGRDRFPALSALSGDEGARGLLNSDPGRVASLDMPSLGVDLDTPDDYTAWRSTRT
jgi:molybdenum cofactor cytidylyltransferase